MTTSHVELVRHHLWHNLEGKKPTRSNRGIRRVLIVAILLTALMVMFGSMSEFEQKQRFVFGTISAVLMAVFLAEYVSRLWASTADPEFKAFRGSSAAWRWRHATSAPMIMDLCAMAGLAFWWVSPGLTRALRMLVVLKLFRHTDAEDKVFSAVRHCAPILKASYLLSMIWLLVTATLLHVIERNVQPDKFGDIPSSLWWSIVTFTTIGYGDVFPLSPLGKVVAGVCLLVGIVLVAIPASALAASYMEGYRVKRERESPERTFCPHCGKKLRD